MSMRGHSKRTQATWASAMVLTAAALGACTPTVKVQAPDKPIVINLNVKIEQEVRIKVEEDAKELLRKRPDIF